MLIFGGNNSKTWTASVDALVPGNKQWMKAYDMPMTGGYWAAAALPGHVYLIGGAASKVLSDTCLRYDFPTNDWFEASFPSPMLSQE